MRVRVRGKAVSEVEGRVATEQVWDLRAAGIPCASAMFTLYVSTARRTPTAGRAVTAMRAAAGAVTSCFYVGAQADSIISAQRAIRRRGCIRATLSH